MPNKPKALLSWSTGKDSAYAFVEAQRQGEYEIVGLITTITAAYGRVSMHGVRESLLDRQIAELGVPCHKVAIPVPCSNEIYRQKMSETLNEVKAAGIQHVIFGDLFLEDIRHYREEQLRTVDMHAVFPLWGRNTRELAHAMIDAGMIATIACLDPRKLPAALTGRRFDKQLLAELPAEVDPCGENGEFHTFVSAGPMFANAIDIEVGPVVEREGFSFADLTA